MRAAPELELLNDAADGVSQTTSETLATGGGIGKNSRLDIKVTGETRYYYLLIHRGAGDKGSFTLTANRLDYPQGRLPPDITVDQENRNSVSISWTESKKTHNSLVAPETTYEIDRRTLPDGKLELSVAWADQPRQPDLRGHWPDGSHGIRDKGQDGPNPRCRQPHLPVWDTPPVYPDDCAETSGSNTCSIDVNQSKKGRIGYDSYGDLDGYTVRLVSNTTYVIKSQRQGHQYTAALVDPYLELIRPQLRR